MKFSSSKLAKYLKKQLEKIGILAFGAFFLTARIDVEFGFAILVDKMAKLPVDEDPRNK